MSKCDTCKNRGDCKESEAHRRFEELVAVGEDVNCTGYEYEKPLTQEDMAVENEGKSIYSCPKLSDKHKTP